MSRRRPTYKNYVAAKMRNVEFAQGVVMDEVEGGETVEYAVRMEIESADLKEFVEKSGIAFQHLSAFVLMPSLYICLTVAVAHSSALWSMVLPPTRRLP